MRARLTQESLRALMRELARTAPPGRDYRVWLVGGGTAVLEGWRDSSIDADLVGSPDDIFRDVQVLSKVVRGFARDIDDAKSFVASGLVEPETLKKLVRAIPASAYSKYPRLSAQSVAAAVDEFLAGLGC